MSETTIAIRLRIIGRVQGVWYRGWAVDQARELGLSGWVRNRADGTVEALVAGPESQVRSMIERCRRGPSAACVDRVVEEPSGEPATGEFRQVPTA